jgi:hypothetical protein
MLATEQFALKFQNIPLLNLRIEFNETYAFVQSAEAEACLKSSIKAIQTPMLIWGGMPEDLMTLLIQRAVLGIEAYLPGALLFTAASIGSVSAELASNLKNPFSYGSKSAVENIYHRMPSAVHEELSLRHLDQELYGRTVAFYRLVRNPIFHGKQLDHPEITSIRKTFAHLAQLYEWIDYWYNPEKLISGGGTFAGVRSRHVV